MGSEPQNSLLRSLISMNATRAISSTESCLRIAILICVAGFCGLVNPVFAASTSGVLDVRLRLEPSCSFITNDIDDALLSFGEASGVDALATDGYALLRKNVAMLGIACSSAYTGANAPLLTVSYGLHAQGSQRYLAGNGGERIAYDLYADAARHVPLDPTTPLQLVIPTSGVTTAIPIYGRIPHIGNPLAGSYTDVVWLTLSY
jgi:spore coat protein U-like protein